MSTGMSVRIRLDFARRVSLAAAVGAAALALAGVGPAAAKEAMVRHHALSLVGEPAYKAGFKQFDWVKPDAPKGGTVRMWAEGSFDSLNNFTIQGEIAAELDLIYDQLMAPSPDEQATVYGLVAEWVSFPADYSS